MVKTTVYLADDIAASLQKTAQRERQSEAELIREAIRHRVQATPTRPQIPLVTDGLGDPTSAERVDEFLRDA